MDAFYYVVFPNHPKPMMIIGSAPKVSECLSVRGGLWRVDTVTEMHLIHGEEKKLWEAGQYTVVFVSNICIRLDL